MPEATGEAAPVVTPEPAASPAPEPAPEPEPIIDPVTVDDAPEAPGADAPAYELGSVMYVPDGAEFFDAASWTPLGRLPKGEVVRLESGPVQDVLGVWWYLVLADDGHGMVAGEALAPLPGEAPAEADAPVMEPMPDAESSLAPTVEPTPAAAEETTPAGAEQVLVEAVGNGDGADLVTAGETSGYRFRLTNMTSAALAVKPRVTNSQPGWGAVVTDTRTGKAIDGAIRLDAGGAVTIGVRVTAPANAKAGTTNQTTVAAEIVTAGA